MLKKTILRTCSFLLPLPLVCMASCSSCSATNTTGRIQLSKGRFVQIGESTTSLMSRIGTPSLVCTNVKKEINAGKVPREVLLLTGRDEYSSQEFASTLGYFVYFDHKMARMCLNAARSDPVFTRRQVCFLGSIGEFVVVSISNGTVTAVSVEHVDFVLFDAEAQPAP